MLFLWALGHERNELRRAVCVTGVDIEAALEVVF